MTQEELIQAVGQPPRALCKLAILIPSKIPEGMYCDEFMQDIARLTEQNKPLVFVMMWGSDIAGHRARYSRVDGWSRDWVNFTIPRALPHMAWYRDNNFDIEAMI